VAATTLAELGGPLDEIASQNVDALLGRLERLHRPSATLTAPPIFRFAAAEASAYAGSTRVTRHARPSTRAWQASRSLPPAPTRARVARSVSLRGESDSDPASMRTRQVPQRPRAEQTCACGTSLAMLSSRIERPRLPRAEKPSS
jgi:hypothetical protein